MRFAALGVTEKVTAKTSEKVTNRVTDKEIANNINKVTDVVLRKTTKKEYQVLVALSENPTASYAELAKKIGVSKKQLLCG